MSLEILDSTHDVERRFIRFSVWRVQVSETDEDGNANPLYDRQGQWKFRADAKVNGTQIYVEWFQPSQELEPPPDLRMMVPATMSLLARLDRR